MVQTGTEYIRSSPNKENLESLSAPPGFVSLTSFVLKRAEKSDETNNTISVLGASKQESIKTDTMFDMTDDADLNRTLKCRPWILDKSNYIPEESESGKFDMVIDLLLLLKMHRCFDILCYFIVVKLNEILYSVSSVYYEYLVCITISIGEDVLTHLYSHPLFSKPQGYIFLILTLISANMCKQA
jgi:hypothetical protein